MKLLRPLAALSLIDRHGESGDRRQPQYRLDARRYWLFAPDVAWLYFALAQFPICLLPHLLKPLARQFQQTPHAKRWSMW